MVFGEKLPFLCKYRCELNGFRILVLTPLRDMQQVTPNLDLKKRTVRMTAVGCKCVLLLRDSSPPNQAWRWPNRFIPSKRAQVQLRGGR